MSISANDFMEKLKEEKNLVNETFNEIDDDDDDSAKSILKLILLQIGNRNLSAGTLLNLHLN